MQNSAQKASFEPSMNQNFIDARQQPCPMPILLLKKWRKQNSTASDVMLLATDPNSRQDLLHFCQVNDYKIEQLISPETEFYYHITF